MRFLYEVMEKENSKKNGEGKGGKYLETEKYIICGGEE